MKTGEKKKFFDTVEDVDRHLLTLRRQGKTVVTTNGCFDILHAGHVQYLYEAASLGDILVVGVNADATVRKLKGDGRPVQNEQDRSRILAALEMVDCTFIFREDDPRRFLETLKPAVHVKGGDYGAGILEQETVERNGGVVRIVSFLDGRSTTSVLRRAGSAQEVSHGT